MKKGTTAQNLKNKTLKLISWIHFTHLSESIDGQAADTLGLKQSKYLVSSIIILCYLNSEVSASDIR